MKWFALLIVLQKVLQLHAVVAQPQIATALGANNAIGDRVAQAEGAAHGKHEIADLQLAGFAAFQPLGGKR